MTLLQDKDFVSSQKLMNNSIEEMTYYKIKQLLSTELPKYKSALRTFFRENVFKISCCVDDWVDNGRNSYMGVTAHFIYQEKLETVALALISVDKEDGQSIFNEFSHVIMEYDLQNKLIAVTTDNGMKYIIVRFRKSNLY